MTDPRVLVTLLLCLTLLSLAIIAFVFPWDKLRSDKEYDRWVRLNFSEVRDLVETLQRAHDKQLYELDQQMMRLTRTVDDSTARFEAQILEAKNEGNRLNQLYSSRRA